MSLVRTDEIFMMDLMRLGGGLRSTSAFLLFSASACRSLYLCFVNDA